MQAGSSVEQGISVSTDGPPLDIVFFGSGAFGLPTLQMISRRHRLLAIVTQPDRPAGRKQRLTPTPIGLWAAEHLPGIPQLKPADINAPDWIDRVRQLDVGTPDDRTGGWVIIAFGQKLTKPLLADRFAINLHASLLPRWRGAAPINHAIIAGDTTTGNTVITLADRMDAGLVLGQSERPIASTTTAGELHDLLASDGPPLIDQVLVNHQANRLNPITQDESRVTIARKLTKSIGNINLAALSASDARCTIHGLNPWPAVTVLFRNSPLKLLRASSDEYHGLHKDHAPGAIIDPTLGRVACLEGTVLVLHEVQPAGKSPMSWRDFANGAKPIAGEQLEPMLPHSQAKPV